MIILKSDKKFGLVSIIVTISICECFKISNLCILLFFRSMCLCFEFLR